MQGIIPTAVAQLESKLSLSLPLAKDENLDWLYSLGRGRPLVDYFTTDWGYPLFLLPGFFEEQVTQTVDEAFRTDLVYSTVNGYLFIRLLDDVTDNSPQARPSLLPLSAFFHHEFEKPYRKHFSYSHPFWTEFEHHWLHCHESTIVDRKLTDIDHASFCAISAQKTCAAKIPLIALGYHYGRTDLVGHFLQIAELFSYYVQLVDDLFDWPEDNVSGQGTTYFLSEAKRRKHPNESLAEWALREGISWAVKWCEQWLDEILVVARALNYGSLLSLVQQRREGLQQQVIRLRRQLDLVTPLASAFSPRE